MSALAAMLALATAAAVPPEEGVPGYCLIERVVARADGVGISLADNYPASITRASGGPPQPVEIGPRQPPLRLHPGETLRINFTHGVCRLTVAANAGRLGLLARNWGQGVDDSMMFFPAERRR